MAEDRIDPQDTPPVEGDDGTDELDVFDALLVEMKASGLSDAEAALQLGCSTKTIQRHRKRPAVRTELAERKAERISQVTALLGEAAIDAVATMRAGLVSTIRSDRLRAAQMIVASLTKFREGIETELAIAELRDDLLELRALLTEEVQP
jgi:hypothetical protein